MKKFRENSKINTLECKLTNKNNMVWKCFKNEQSENSKEGFERESKRKVFRQKTD
jgi:hypothetical protein